MKGFSTEEVLSEVQGSWKSFCVASSLRKLRAMLLPVGPLSHRRISSRPTTGLTNPLFQEGARPHQLSLRAIGSPSLLSTTAAPRDARPLVPGCPLLQVGAWREVPGWERDFQWGGLSAWKISCPGRDVLVL